MFKSLLTLNIHCTISDLFLEFFPSSGTKPQILLFIVTTNPSRLYKLIGGPDLEALIQSYNITDSENYSEFDGILILIHRRM